MLDELDVEETVELLEDEEDEEELDDEDEDELEDDDLTDDEMVVDDDDDDTGLEVDEGLTVLEDDIGWDLDEAGEYG